MNNCLLNSSVITKIKTWNGFENFDGNQLDFLTKDPLIPDGCQHTVLFEAIKRKEKLIIEYLVKFGANVNFILNLGNFWFDTPLKNACINGQLEIVDFLLKNGADVNLSWGNDYSAIHSIDISIDNYLDILKILIKAGADVNSCGGYALQKAIKYRSFDAIELLIKAGARTDIKTLDKSFNGRTAFMSLLDSWMDYSKDEQKELFYLFYKNIGNINIQDDDGNSLIFYAIHNCFEVILFHESININLTNKKQNTVLNQLLLKIENGWYDGDNFKEEIKFLLIAGSDIAIKNINGDFPQLIAKRIGNKDIIEMINSPHDIVNKEDNNGLTPLFIASLKGYYSRVRWLINKGADVNYKNRCNKIINCVERLPLFTETIESQDITALMVAQNSEVINILLQSGAKINQKNSFGNTALMMYANDKWHDGIEILILNGADANITNKWFENALKIYRNGLKKTNIYQIEFEKTINLLKKHTKQSLFQYLMWFLVGLFKPYKKEQILYNELSRI